MNLPLQLDRSAQIPLQDQLFEQLRQLIVTGRLKPNTRVIATRFLAEQVGVSRRTVLFAYERLIAEGYLETRPAIGTFVAPSLPVNASPVASLNGVADVPRQAALHPATIPLMVPVWPAPAAVRFDFTEAAAGAANALPPKVWLRWMRDVLDAEPEIFSRPAPVAGEESLRRVIADYLAATRGIVVSADQVVIVSGRRQACSVVAHLFHRPLTVIEAPCDDAIARFFRIRSRALVCVPVDDGGLDTGLLPEGPVDLAYVSPARHNPLGGSMPPARRTDLIAWARHAGAYVIEDDSDSELRYQGVAHPALAATDPYGLVFYIGSFAKVLGEGLCIGYLLVPSEFSATIAAIKAMGMESGQSLEQSVIANLIASGEYDHHLRRLRKTYLERRDSLIGALKTHFGEVSLMGTATGTELTWLLSERFPSASAVCEAALRHGVRLKGIVDAQWQDSPYYERALVLDYAALTPEKLRKGIDVLAAALKSR